MARDLRTQPTHDEIARRAYEIFVERGCPQGRDVEHWLEAEGQLTAAAAVEPQPQSQPRQNIPRAQNSERTQPRLRR